METGQAHWARDQRQAGALGIAQAVILRAIQKVSIQGQEENTDMRPAEEQAMEWAA